MTTDKYTVAAAICRACGNPAGCFCEDEKRPPGAWCALRVDQATAALSALQSDGWRCELKALVDACGAIPPGSYSPKEIEDWLCRDMKPAVERARATLIADQSGVKS